MAVGLRPLTRDNIWQVVEDLTLHPGQEAFVAPNIDSIANAAVEPTFVPLAIYANDALVGFAMYGQHPRTSAWWVIRLMIDREHQGKGYGRAAMKAVIAMMVERVGCDEIVTSFNPENTVAAHLYASLGFQPTGEIEDNEPLQLLRVAEHYAALEQERARSAAPAGQETAG
ncbi:MAG: GNAT family N-acetyltransferase [Thermomicrobiales bacterium]|nr:GNAT family N-acetyltransferase [Thermomicrobiales bacterium]